MKFNSLVDLMGMLSIIEAELVKLPITGSGPMIEAKRKTSIKYLTKMTVLAKEVIKTEIDSIHAKGK